MSGCLDRVSCGCDCDCLEPVKEWLRPKRNVFASVIAGTLVSITTSHCFDAYPYPSVIVLCSFLLAGGQSLMLVLSMLNLSMWPFTSVGLSQP
jgi:hypothetical protein